ncbi:HU family DNA-binding protein [Rhodanobacter denitrificans]|uniref:HU family DNA-binding protein n=1 Tax=Rhodanobacter denitrificans TaxID=666685 RepID=UPI001F43A05D|nr:HU family DNA-binding protein [Rhodanobacter denitrificans]UJJ60653.1 HU family DNA-binding protein [Rhodanobacter denitrificans]
MTKSELAQRLQAETGLSHASALAIINHLARIVATHVAKGGTVQVAGFGQFLSKDWPGRQAKSPRTGKPVWLPSTRIPVFRPSAGFKAAVRDARPLGEADALAEI